MSIPVQCPSCGARYQVKEELAGRKAKCPKCGSGVPISQQARDSTSSSAGLRGLFDEELGSAGQASGVSTTSSQCPVCHGPLDPKTILCLRCGFNVRSGKLTKRRSDSALRASLGAGLAGKKLRRAKGRTKLRLAVQPQAFRAVGKLFGTVAVLIVAGIITWCVVSVVRRGYSRVEREGAYARIGEILESDSPDARALAEHVPDLVWYANTVGTRSPNLAARRKETLKKLIPQLPTGVDIEPLLGFTPDSFAYEAVLALAVRNTDPQWRVKKSCDPDPNTRTYGADLLILGLPLVDFDEAARGQLMERTSIEEKLRRYEPFRDECQRKAEKVLPGEYSLRIDAEYVPGLEHDIMRNRLRPIVSRYGWATRGPIVNVSCEDRLWSIEFFGERWTGAIDEIAGIDAHCAAREVWERFSLEHVDHVVVVLPSQSGEILPAKSELENSTIHLRFDVDDFLVEFEPLRQYHANASDRDRTGFSPGFRSLKSVLAKSAGEQASP